VSRWITDLKHRRVFINLTLDSCIEISSSKQILCRLRS
jgi:hypothetical protein